MASKTAKRLNDAHAAYKAALGTPNEATTYQAFCELVAQLKRDPGHA